MAADEPVQALAAEVSAGDSCDIAGNQQRPQGAQKIVSANNHNTHPFISAKHDGDGMRCAGPTVSRMTTTAMSVPRKKPFCRFSLRRS